MTRKQANAGPSALERAFLKRDAATKEIDQILSAQPETTLVEKAAYRQHLEDDRLWNDHLRRLTQLKSLMALLSVTDGGDLEAFGADVLTIAADLSEQCRADFEGRLVNLAARGSRAELAEKIREGVRS